MKTGGKDEGMPDMMHIFSVVSTNVVFYFPQMYLKPTVDIPVMLAKNII